jgi:hypothetical protein
MKTIKILLQGLLFITGAVLAVWFFMPWKQVGESLLLAAGRRSGVPVVYSSVESAPGGFVVENLEIQKFRGMVDGSAGTLTVVPDLWASLVNMAPTCRISFTGSVLDVTVALKKIPGIVIGSGRVVVSLSAQGVLLDRLRSDGDLSMAGALFISPSAPLPIRWADVTIDVKSDSLEQELSAVAELNLLPLEQESPGRWHLRRAVNQGS